MIKRSLRVGRDIVRKYRTLEPRVWFPIDERRRDEFAIIGRRFIDFPQGQQLLVFALPKDSQLARKELRGERLTREEIEGSDGFVGFLIDPEIELQGTSAGDLSGEELVKFLSIMLPHHVKHIVNDGSKYGYVSDSSILALRVGEGNCFHRSTLLVSLLRGLGNSARVVGRPDILIVDEGSRGHWWGDVFFDDFEIEVDPSFNVGTRYSVEFLRSLGQDDRRTFRILHEFADYMQLSVAGNLTEPELEKRVVALEVGLDEIDIIDLELSL